MRLPQISANNRKARLEFGMPTSLRAEAQAVHFEANRMCVLFGDGRELRVPLTRFPLLVDATPAARDHWRLIGQGEGIHWDDVDEDVSIPHLLGLPCE